jgi:hypothetical protein
MLGLMMCLSTLYPLGMLVKVMQMGGGLRVNSFLSANLNLLGVGGVKFPHFLNVFKCFECFGFFFLVER